MIDDTSNLSTTAAIKKSQKKSLRKNIINLEYFEGVFGFSVLFFFDHFFGCGIRVDVLFIDFQWVPRAPRAQVVKTG